MNTCNLQLESSQVLPPTLPGQVFWRLSMNFLWETSLTKWGSNDRRDIAMGASIGLHMSSESQEKSQSYRNLPYFQHLGSDEVFEAEISEKALWTEWSWRKHSFFCFIQITLQALDRVRQANLLQIQLKMQKDSWWTLFRFKWLRSAVT